jgi:conjugal transfer pilus assembly protein TraL
MVKIPRYIDSPPQILYWELDEMLFLFVSLIVGVLTRTLGYCVLVGLASVWAISKLKGGQSDGVVFHWCWWHGIPLFTLSGPPSDIREYLE